MSLLPMLLEKRDKLQREIQDAADAINSLDRDLEREKSRHLRATAALELLSELIAEDSISRPPEPATVSPQVVIMRDIAANPGSKVVDVFARVAGKMRTRARDQRHLVRSTMRNLVTYGRLEKRGRQYYPANYLAKLEAGAELRSSLRPKVLRNQPAVRMANRSLPNPYGDNQK